VGVKAPNARRVAAEGDRRADSGRDPLPHQRTSSLSKNCSKKTCVTVESFLPYLDRRARGKTERGVSRPTIETHGRQQRGAITSLALIRALAMRGDR
jgi:hypothetical protein